MFRVAHYWATHIDVAEYVELLWKVYERITCRKIIRGADGSVEVILPRIEVNVFQEKEVELRPLQDENAEMRETEWRWPPSAPWL